MTVAENAAPHFEIERVVKRTFSVIGNNFLVFALLSLIATIPSAALTWAEPPPSAEFFDVNTIMLTAATVLVYVISMFILQAALVHGTIADLNGQRASFADCLSTGLKHFVPLLLIAIVYFFVVFVGLLFFIVAGVIIAVMLSVAVPVRVVEHTRVLASLDRSHDLTNGHRWAIFGLFVAYFIAQLVVETVVSMIVVSILGAGFMAAPTPEAAVAAAAAANSWPTILATALAQMITAVLSATGTASIYYELRQIKEGIGPEALAAVFD